MKAFLHEKDPHRDKKQWSVNKPCFEKTLKVENTLLWTNSLGNIGHV